jgi:hypothetical protein
MPRKVRDYADEYKYHGTPEQRAKRAARNRARRAYEKVHGDLPSNVDVDHKRALSKGGAPTAASNLRAVKKEENRSFARNPDGSMKSQISRRERKR